MKENITFNWGENHLLIDLGNRIEPRIRILFWMELMLTSGLATIFLLQAFPLNSGWIHWITGVGAALLYFMAAFRFLRRMFFREQVVLDGTHITLVQRTFFSHKSQSYDRRHMGPLHYVGKDAKTDHPLKGRLYDYWGFETHERLIQTLHQDGSLYFNYGGFPVRFARGIYSWHAEEVVRIMKLYCGASLKLGAEWERMLQEQEWDDSQN